MAYPKRAMTIFRPCIDLHEGVVKQIVGGSLRDEGPAPETNYVSERGAAHFASRYRDDGLRGGHLIKLGPGNDEAAREALAAFPAGLQVGGGVGLENAREWLERGASHVIVTSWLFVEGRLDLGRVAELSSEVGAARLVIDLSCRRVDDGWRVATDRWQTVTDTPVDRPTLETLAGSCAEFLVHAADVEGKQQGIDEELVRHLGEISPLPTTYAGGARDIDDLRLVDTLSQGRLDLTFGSALDLFGGSRVRYSDCVGWNDRVVRG